MIITSQQYYENLLKQFIGKLSNKIPPEENVNIEIITATSFQYGSSCVKVILTTESSGVDQYLIWIDHLGCGNFIRNIT